MSEPVLGPDFLETHRSLEMRRLVRQSADEVVTALQTDTRAGFSARYTLGHVACALVDTEGVESAHEYASNTLQTLGLHASDQFGVWADLYKSGDKRALPEARRVLGIAAYERSFVEQIGAMELGGLHHTERLVELVEAGDTGSTAFARGMAKHVYVIDRAALFGRLYCTGDGESLDPALDAAKEAKIYTEMTGDRHYHRSNRALTDMASHAIKQGKVEDALTLIDAVEGEASKASLHISFFKHGRHESLTPVLQRLQVADKYEAETIEQGLAAAGYAPALEALKQRVKPYGKPSAIRGKVRQPRALDMTARLQDLTVLHDAGVEGADQRVLELVRTSEHPEHNLYHLGRVGLQAEEERLAEQLYKADPTPQNAEHLLYHRLDIKLWRDVFNHWLHERNDPWQASGWVRSLASRVRASKTA